MAESPIIVLTVIMFVLVGEGLLFGAEIAERSFPAFEEPSSSGLLGAVEGAVSVLQAVWGAVVFFFNMITFNIPGAEFWVRAPMTVIFGGALFWSISSLARGN